jgi:hypothetical protein
MALSKNTPIKEVLGDFEDLPLYQAIHAYEGSMIFNRADGYATNVAGGLTFRGHADAEADNASGASGAKNVRVRRGNYRLQVTLTGVALTDQGKDVYASDDGTLTLTATSNSRVGKVARYVSSNTCIVEFEAGVGGDVVNHEHTAGTDGGALTSPRVITGINDTNGNELLKVTATGSAINEITIGNAATGNAPSITATGGDAPDIGLLIDTKGAGVLTLGSADSKVAFFGGAGAVKAAHIANSSGDDATAVNAILVVLENLGLVATS